MSADSVEQLAPLLFAEATHAPIVIDPGLFHDRGGLGRAVARQGLDDLGNLGLLGDIVLAVEQLGDADLPGLDRGQKLAALLARSLGLRQRVGALLRVRVGRAMSLLRFEVDQLSHIPRYPAW